MRRGDIGHVEGRILPHQDDIDTGQIELLERAKAVVVALPAHDFERPRAGIKPPVVQRQGVGQIMEQGMPAGLGFEGQSKGRIRIDVDRIDRIHLDRDGQSHADLRCTTADCPSPSRYAGPSLSPQAGRGAQLFSLAPLAGRRSG